MSQNVIDFSGDPSGTQLLDSLLTPMKQNILTNNSGTSRPSYAVAHTIWTDTTTTPWVVKYFDGTDDISIGTVNATTNAFTPSGLALNNTAATAAPTINEDSGDGYSVGSLWINVTADVGYVCVDASVGAAVWKRLTSTSFIETLMDDADATTARTTLDAEQRANSLPSATAASNDYVIIADTSASNASKKALISDILSLGGGNSIQDFRLTLTTGVPVTTTDVTGATTLYATPYKGNRIALYDGSAWNVRTSAQFSLALGTLTSAKPYDVFCYDNAGVPTLEFTVWTNDTTRATALAYQDGILVKSGTTTRRYLGTFYTTSTTTTEDSVANRYLWNYYNRIARTMRRLESTASWTYTTATWRQARASTSNQLNFVTGASEDCITARVCVSAGNGGGSNVDMGVAVGVDSTTTPSPLCIMGGSQSASGVAPGTGIHADYSDYLSAGKHSLMWLEISKADGTTTWYANGGTTFTNTGGITGTILA